MNDIGDCFLSEEDLDLRNMSENELFKYWDFWLGQAQASNETDKYDYSHGVFLKDPSEPDPDRNTGART